MKNTVNIPQMETIKATAALFNLPVHFIRQKVADGEIVAVKAGNRYLVNIDRLADYLNSGTTANQTRCSDEDNAEKIKPIQIR